MPLKGKTAIRDDKASKKQVVAPLEFNKGSIQNINKKLENSSSGYLTGDEWKAVLEEEGIHTSAEHHITQVVGPYFITGTTTTTTIGRTNLSANLSNRHSYDTNTASTRQQASENIDRSRIK